MKISYKIIWFLSILTVFYSVFATAEVECEKISLDEYISDNVDIRERTNKLNVFVQSCPREKVDSVLKQIVLIPTVEWFLKKTALDQMSEQNFCEESVQNYLLNTIRKETGDWHTRESVIWFLSNTPTECDTPIVQFFVEFIQQEQPDLTMEVALFRQQIINNLFWALVRLGIKSSDDFVSKQLKNIAMNEDLNVHFRITAVSALQDMSVFRAEPAQALYEVVRDSVVKTSNGFETYFESIRNEKNQRVQLNAFAGLVEVMRGNNSFFSFLLKRVEDIEEPDRIRWEALNQQDIPDDIAQYVRVVLEEISIDPKVHEVYRDYAKDLLTH